jgi:hypothetical protein
MRNVDRRFMGPRNRSSTAEHIAHTDIDRRLVRESSGRMLNAEPEIVGPKVKTDAPKNGRKTDEIAQLDRVHIGGCRVLDRVQVGGCRAGGGLA